MPEEETDDRITKAELLARIEKWATEADRLSYGWLDEKEYARQTKTDDPEQAYWEGFSWACMKIGNLAKKLPD